MVKPSMTDYHIKLRQSQVKFPANDLTFNVIRGATFGQGYLNRQIITLLYCLGVPEEYFLSMQRKAKEYASVNAISAKFMGKKKVKKLSKKEEINILECMQREAAEAEKV